MDMSELREEIETDFASPGSRQSGEYLRDRLVQRLTRLLPDERAVIRELLTDWLTSGREPYASQGIAVAEALAMRELKPELERLLLRVERGEMLWPYYASRIRDVIQSLDISQ